MIGFLKFLPAATYRIFVGIGALATSLGLILNTNTRTLLRNSWFLGWGIALIEFILLLFFFSRSSKSSDTVEATDKDVELLESRLKDFGPTSPNLLYLTHNVTFTAFPVKLLDEFERLVREWTADSRTIESKELKNSFDELVENMLDFYVTCNAEMFPLEIRRTGSKEIDYDRMQIPPEWKHQQPERYSDTQKILSEKQGKLLESLQKMNRLVHKYRRNKAQPKLD